MEGQDNRIYEFANFCLEPGKRILLRDGQVVPLRPKLFNLLIYLIEHRDAVLEKEKITREVWENLSQGSSEKPYANLTNSIKELRQVLGDDSDNPIFIETVPRRGYRFIAPAPVIEEPQSESSRRQGTAYLSWSPIFIFAALVALGVLLAWGSVKPGRGRQPEVAGTVNSASSEKQAGVDSAGGAAAGSQDDGQAGAGQRIYAIDPPTPLAWVGDQPIVVTGDGFQPGQTVTMTFPSGGFGNLSGSSQVTDLTNDSFTLIAAFNNIPGEYSIRVNTPDGRHSNWFTFRVAPLFLKPEITEVRPGRIENGVRWFTFTGRHFQQNLGAVIYYPDGSREFPFVNRASDNSFDVNIIPRGQNGTYKLQALNPSGNKSNVIRFTVSVP
ncbi:MAG: transcriptional regulator [Acidobacteria bacterium]|nr:transcriptional regulator [Acidobacteriota bacterium]